MNIKEDRVLQLYNWCANHGGTGLVSDITVVATSVDEARGMVLGDKYLSPEAIDMVRFSLPVVKTLDSVIKNCWDFRQPRNDSTKAS